MGVALVLPVILLFWFARRAFYLEGKPSGALSGSLVYSAFLVVGLMYLNHLRVLSGILAFLLMALASLVASGALLYRLRPRPFIGYRTVEISPKRIIRENWGYGKWVLAITLVHWLSGDVYYILVTAFLGFEEAGALRALQNLVLPINQVLTALGLLLLPWLSGRVTTKTVGTIKGDVSRITVLMVVLTGMYCLAVLAFRKELLNLMYGEKYAEFAYLRPYLIAVPVITALGIGVQTGLRALQAPRVIFVGYCVTAIVTISFGVGFVRLWGLDGRRDWRTLWFRRHAHRSYLVLEKYVSGRKGSQRVAMNNYSNLRIGWLMPSSVFRSPGGLRYWEPIIREFVKVFPRTTYLTTGKIHPCYETTLNVHSFGKCRIINLFTKP